MKQTEELWIRHGIDPTVVEPSDKKRFIAWCSKARCGEIKEFEEFADGVARSLTAKGAALLEQAECVLALTNRATAAIEPLMVGYPERAVIFSAETNPRKLTEQHVRMLTAMEKTVNDAARLAARLVSPPMDCGLSLLTEVTLRHIALLESGGQEALALRYDGLSKKATACIESIDKARGQLAAYGNTLHGTVSELVTNASHELTAINRQNAPQATYFRILQQTLSRLHDLSQAIKQTQKEVSHVQISDGL